MAEQYDLIVIGSGPAGQQGAAQAAALGKQVALVERETHLGGAGITTGTMPSKMLRETAATLAGLRQRDLPGVRVALQPKLTLGDLMYGKHVGTEGAWGLIRRNFERLNIRIVWGVAEFADPHTVRVRHSGEDGPVETELTGDVVLIATGARPSRPPLFPFDHQRVCDSDDILHLDHLPASLAVIGGGTIGCEYASIFNALGAQVTLVETRSRLLGFVDQELTARWQRLLEQRGMCFLLEDEVVAAERVEAQVALRLRRGQSLRADVVLVAVGRQGSVAGLNLEAAGVQANEQGMIAVNDHYQTAVPHIYAAGDVIGFPALASTSMEQGRVAMRHAFGQAAQAPLAAVYPLAVYTVPELAMVGFSEDYCQQQGIAYRVGRAGFESNPRAQITGDTSGMLKLLFAPADRRLLGVHVMGEQAAELVHLGAQVLSTGGALEAFISPVYNYPTLSEAYQAAAYDGLERMARADYSNP